MPKCFLTAPKTPANSQAWHGKSTADARPKCAAVLELYKSRATWVKVASIQVASAYVCTWRTSKMAAVRSACMPRRLCHDSSVSFSHVPLIPWRAT